MFIYSEWDRFCGLASNSFNCIRVDEILHQGQDVKWLAIKHDVETSVESALAIAKIESDYGIRATYYVQAYLLEKNQSLLNEIKKLGHEVTYHYDVLDANKGNYDLALEEFSRVVGDFNKLGFTIDTVCPHGNPVMVRDGWTSNKDFFRDGAVRQKFPRIFDIVVDSSTRLPKDYVYISDAGFGWKQIANIHNNDVSNNGDIILSDIDAVLEKIKNNNHVIISSHPHRWKESRIKAVIGVGLFKILRFLVRIMSRNGFIKKILSRFYYLAKKI